MLNSLEAFTYRARDYLEDESFIGASTAAVRSTLETALSAASEWIYSEGAEATEKVLKSKLKELEGIVNPILKRKEEAAKRPDAVKDLKETITHLKEVEQLVDGQIKTQSVESSKSSEAVSKASEVSASAASAAPSVDPMDELEDAEPTASESSEPEITEVPTIYTESDLKKVQDAQVAAQKWLDEQEAAQAKLGPTDDPAFTVQEIQAEKKKLDDVVMDMMMKKMKHFKPPNQNKPKPKPKAKPAKKKADKKSKKAAKDESPKDKAETDSDAKQPSQQEIEDALRRAGVDPEKVKVNLGHKDEITDEAGRKLKKLNIKEDSTEEEILAALDEITKGGAEGKKEGGHDEL